MKENKKFGAISVNDNSNVFSLKPHPQGFKLCLWKLNKKLQQGSLTKCISGQINPKQSVKSETCIYVLKCALSTCKVSSVNIV